MTARSGAARRARGARRVAAAAALAASFAALGAFGQVPPSPDGEDENIDEPTASASASAAPTPSSGPASRGKDGPREPGARSPVALVERDGMVRLPGGPFVFGNADPRAPFNERPALAVSLPPFWIDRTEVTVGAYRSCIQERRCEPLPMTSPQCTLAAGDGDLPVTCVPFRAAEAFCRAHAKRLPTEAEWEYAARGAEKGAYPWGGARASCHYAVTLVRDWTSRSCSGDRPAKVGSRPAGASVFGVLDLAGNAEEWTADWYVETRSGVVGPRSGASHVLRGGGWLTGPSAARVTARNWGSALEAGPNVGFRCARSDGGRL